jgi:hypothetical protein
MIFATLLAEEVAMLALSVSSLFEEAISTDKRLAGNVSNFRAMLEPANFAKLNEIAKAFAFVAFHPSADAAVADYVKSGTMSSDSGPNILALFTVDVVASTPTQVDKDAFAPWLEIDTSVHPSYQLIRLLFEPKAVPPLPGIAFFRELGTNAEAIYVRLKAESESAVREELRLIFSLADRSVLEAHEVKYMDRLAVSLQRQRIEYFKTNRVSLEEWLVRSYQIVGDHAGDLVSVVGLFL